MAISFLFALTDRSQSRHRRHRDHQHHPLSYIAVTPVHLSFARPVVILGYMKDRIADELLCEFPDLFGTAIPCKYLFLKTIKSNVYFKYVYLEFIYWSCYLQFIWRT